MRLVLKKRYNLMAWGGVVSMQKQSVKRLGTILFYIGGIVWIVYAICKYLLGWNVNIRQFLPYHLAAVIPGILLKHGIDIYDKLTNARDKKS